MLRGGQRSPAAVVRDDAAAEPQRHAPIPPAPTSGAAGRSDSASRVRASRSTRRTTARRWPTHRRAWATARRPLDGGRERTAGDGRGARALGCAAGRGVPTEDRPYVRDRRIRALRRLDRRQLATSSGSSALWSIYIAFKYAKLWSEGFDWHDVFRQPRDRLFADVVAEAADDVRARSSTRQARAAARPHAPTPTERGVASRGAARARGFDARLRRRLRARLPPSTPPTWACTPTPLRQAIGDRDEILRLLGTMPKARARPHARGRALGRGARRQGAGARGDAGRARRARTSPGARRASSRRSRARGRGEPARPGGARSACGASRSSSGSGASLADAATPPGGGRRRSWRTARSRCRTCASTSCGCARARSSAMQVTTLAEQAMALAREVDGAGRRGGARSGEPSAPARGSRSPGGADRTLRGVARGVSRCDTSPDPAP